MGWLEGIRVVGGSDGSWDGVGGSGFGSRFGVRLWEMGWRESGCGVGCMESGWEADLMEGP
jgi:hypothetical protein